MHTDVASSQAWWPGSVPFPPDNWLFFVLAVFCDYCSSANGDSGPHGDAVCAHRGRCRARAPVGQGCLCSLLGSVQGAQSCHFQPPPSLRGRAASVCGTRVQAAAIEAPESEITSAAQVMPGRGWRGTKSCRSLLVCSLTANFIANGACPCAPTARHPALAAAWGRCTGSPYSGLWHRLFQVPLICN